MDPGQVWTGEENLGPHREFFVFCCTLYFIRPCVFVLIGLNFTFCLCYMTHSTNIHTPGRIRTRNSSKLSAADPSLRLFGCWNRQNILHLLRFELRTIKPVIKSLYRLRCLCSTRSSNHPNRNQVAIRTEIFRRTRYVDATSYSNIHHFKPQWLPPNISMDLKARCNVDSLRSASARVK